jgi:hypothetical protein
MVPAIGQRHILILYFPPFFPRLAKLLGVTHFLYVWRGDAWGDGLHTVSTSEARKLGLNLELELRYAPDPLLQSRPSFGCM